MRIAQAFVPEPGSGVLWFPVFLGCGIGVYFALPFEPSLIWLSAGGVACIGFSVLIYCWFRRAWPLGFVLLAVILGLLAASFRTHLVSGAVLGWRYYGPVEGRIVKIDRSFSNRLRLTLDQVWLSDVAPEKTPLKVRVSIEDRPGNENLLPGQRVGLTAHLGPPPGPAEPFGFDFQRHSWFLQLGAVGYSRTLVLPVEVKTPKQASLRLAKLRMKISAQVQKQITGQAGAFAAAILVGDRSELDPEILQHLRRANLAHLLAISGLHMGLLTGFVFLLVRKGMCLCPPMALRVPVKKIAAVAALSLGLVYLMLSGGNIATQRAFIMVTVMLLAVLLDRIAVSLRAVALAASIILLFWPETIVQPGFQMSFAATTALVVVFSRLWQVDGGSIIQRSARWLRPVISLVMASLVAGLATAPYAALHFNQVVHFGLFANLLSVPVMAMIVMPCAVAAVMLAPFGGAGPPLEVMGLGISWILEVAEHVSGISHAVTLLPAAPPFVLPLFSFAACLVVLLKGQRKYAGLALAIVALAGWVTAERPLVLISREGGLTGIMTPTGRALNKSKGSGFAACIWLENDGDAAPQAKAAKRQASTSKNGITDVGGWQLGFTKEKTPEQASLKNLCARVDYLVVPKATYEGEGPCLVVDKNMLWRHGSVAIIQRKHELEIITATEATGRRMWNSR